MQRGDIFLGTFPFGEGVGAKLRPLLLLTDSVSVGTEVVVAYISSVIPVSLLPSDILLDAARQPALRLKVVSVLRLHKIGTIHKSSLQRRLGSIDSLTQQQVDSRLKVVLSL